MGYKLSFVFRTGYIDEIGDIKRFNTAKEKLTDIIEKFALLGDHILWDGRQSAAVLVHMYQGEYNHGTVAKIGNIKKEVRDWVSYCLTWWMEQLEVETGQYCDPRGDNMRLNIRFELETTGYGEGIKITTYNLFRDELDQGLVIVDADTIK